MSVVNASKNTAADDLYMELMVNEYLNSGRRVHVMKSKKKCPKYLRYSPFTANGKNDAPSFNPMKHAV